MRGNSNEGYMNLVDFSKERFCKSPSTTTSIDDEDASGAQRCNLPGTTHEEFERLLIQYRRGTQQDATSTNCIP